MFDELGHRGRHDWDLLDRVATNSLSIAELYHAFSHRDLDGLRARLHAADPGAKDADLADHFAPWMQWLTDRVAKDTREHYAAHIRTLVPEGASFPVSRFTAPAIAKWLNERRQLPRKRRPGKGKSRRVPDAPPPPLTSSTKRKYLAAVQSFGRYLVQIGALPVNVAQTVEAPPANKPQIVEIALDDVRRIVDGAEPPYRALFALLYGTGIEISSALACVASDVDVARREVRARGKKTHTRDRVVRAAEWAWPYIQVHLMTLRPAEQLFGGISRKTANTVHRAHLADLKIRHHRMHDARHFYATRAVRAGTPYELVARQLGHADVQMVATRYGRYAPRSEERDRWERIAAQLDEPAHSVSSLPALRV
jgi:integrase